MENDASTIQMEIEAEIHRIIRRIDSHQPTDISTFSEFINLQLGSIIRISKEIEDIISFKEDLTDEREKPLITILDGLDTIIWHIFTYFHDQFDQKSFLTNKIISNHNKDIKNTIEHHLNLLKRSDIDQELTEILVDALYLRLDGCPRFLHLDFSDHLFNYLQTNVKGEISKEKLLKMLISWKFNHPRFFEYYMQNIIGKLRESSTISEHFRDLIFQKKMISQIPVESIIPYNSFLPAINDSLITAIDAELDFMKQLDFLNSELLNSGILDSTYKVSLSVKQLAYLIYLVVEVGIITERKAKRVHEYIISHVSTIETEKISEKSFSNGYYVPNSVDIGIVSDKLAQMLAKAQSQY
ncbi:hypothetical protein [Pedobacter sp. Bi36]|nr:hypothetical protein [Pedobacter sp. Bi36]